MDRKEMLRAVYPRKVGNMLFVVHEAGGIWALQLDRILLVTNKNDEDKCIVMYDMDYNNDSTHSFTLNHTTEEMERGLST